MLRIGKSLWCTLALIILLVATACTAESTPQISRKDDASTKATVIRVVDGDTIKVDIDGREETVRLIGIDAPESVHPDAGMNTVEGDISASALKDILENGQTVWLTDDVTDRDRYGRLLRYLFVALPTVDVLEDREWLESHMLNALLVSGGLAEAKAYPPDTKYRDLFEEISSTRR
jgi:micrococcal nuclease